ncbi:MAG TPA: helix-turn-helix domain-containing protein [Jiangellaceae bacterium]|nr:helix-turn-helix domain-containing protein [Jiangellaceae bacterium]
MSPLLPSPARPTAQLPERQLRRKLEEDPAHPRHIVTVPGTGYRFEM